MSISSTWNSGHGMPSYLQTASKKPSRQLAGSIEEPSLPLEPPAKKRPPFVKKLSSPLHQDTPSKTLFEPSSKMPAQNPEKPVKKGGAYVPKYTDPHLPPIPPLSVQGKSYLPAPSGDPLLAVYRPPQKPASYTAKTQISLSRPTFKLPPLEIPVSRATAASSFTEPMEIEPPRSMDIDPPSKETVRTMTALSLLGTDLASATIKQRNIGDCYLLASFDAIQHHPAAARILQQIQIQEKLPTKKGDPIHYIVTFPSGKRAEFSEAEVGKEKLGKKPLEGHRAWQLLELAYSKATRSERNRKRDNPFENDGEGHSPLIMESGIAKNALYDMFGGEEEEVTCEDSVFNVKNTDPFEDNPDGLINLITFLRKVERESKNSHHILAASSVAKSGTKDTVELVTNHHGVTTHQSFPRSHAFSIRSFNLDTTPPTITIANPHDTANKVHTLSLREFCKIFWRVSGVKLPSTS